MSMCLRVLEREKERKGKGKINIYAIVSLPAAVIALTHAASSSDCVFDCKWPQRRTVTTAIVRRCALTIIL